METKKKIMIMVKITIKNKTIIHKIMMIMIIRKIKTSLKLCINLNKLIDYKELWIKKINY